MNTDKRGSAFICVYRRPICFWSLDKMTHGFDVVIERDEEGFYVASVPELHGCHTQARSLDLLMERIQEAVELCLEVS